MQATVIYRKTFGIQRVMNGYYAIVTEVDLERRYKHCIYDLKYKNQAFAIKKAEDFVRSLYKPWTRDDGTRVVFEFENMGLIDF